MIVKMFVSGDGTDFDDTCSIVIDDAEFANVGSFEECPEDANLVRDLKFVLDIPTLLHKVYLLGLDKKKFVITKGKMDDEGVAIKGSEQTICSLPLPES